MMDEGKIQFRVAAPCFYFDESSSVSRQSIVMLQKSMPSIDQGCWIMNRESGVNAIQLITVEFRYIHYTILNKFKLIKYPFEIPSDTRHDHLSDTILFDQDL